MPADVLEAASGSMIGWSRPRLGVNYDLHSEQCSSPGQSNWPVFPRVEKRPTSNPPYLRNGLTYPPHSVLSLSPSFPFSLCYRTIHGRGPKIALGYRPASFRMPNIFLWSSNYLLIIVVNTRFYLETTYL